ncbi:MAG: hypothetical protein M1600_06095 [Firmicutes bacterium]|nr:hypothetical protein [Bacillota bacterium]
MFKESWRTEAWGGGIADAELIRSSTIPSGNLHAASQVPYPSAPISVDGQEPIKLLLSSGETEILATNVSAQELPYERAGAVYFSRWGVEVHFDVLKNRFEIANFAGILAAAIYPEHQATVLLGNLCALAETEVQALWDAQQAEHPEDYKYARYKINTSVAVGQWKDAWVTILLAEDADVRNRAFWDFIHEIRKHVTTIRPNRQFPRRPHREPTAIPINVAVPFRANS